MRVETRMEYDCWSVFVDGERIVDCESYTVAHTIAGYLRGAMCDTSECSDVAEVIRRAEVSDAD